MAIKLSIDLSDATFAELSAVIGYAHQLGVDADEKLTFEGTVLNIEFDGDLQFDDVFDAFDEAEIELDNPREDGPIYADDLIDEDEDYRAQTKSPINDEVINEIRDGISSFVDGIVNGLGQGRRGGRYGDFGGPRGPRGPRNDGPFGPFGPFGPDTAVRVSSGYGRVLASKSNIFSTLQQEADCKPDHACQPHRAQTKPRHLEIRPGVGVAVGVPVE